MLKDLKIGARLYILVGFLSLLLIVIGVLGLRGIKTTDDSLETIYHDRLVPAVLLSEMNTLRWQNIHEILLAQLHDPRLPASRLHEADHPVTKHTEVVEANRAKNDKLWEQYMATYQTTEEKKLAEGFKAKRAEAFSQGLKPAIALLKARKFDDTNLIITNKIIPLFNQAQQDFEALMQLQVDEAKKEKDKADDNYSVTRNLTIAGIIIGILLAFGTGWWIIRSITNRLTESVSAISSSANQITATVAQHERTANQQATMVSETTATVDELGASAKQSSEQAASAAAVAQKATSETEEGARAVREAIEAMNSLKDKIGAVAGQILRLGEQTGQVGNIANMVKDLAGEINMLALNAAVEAARAGEHGKGFAVVASEVRKLADQSKKSAEQANVLIADIQKTTNSTIMKTEEGTKKVEDVTRLARQVGELFSSLAGAAGNVYENAQQVLLNTKQQSAALNQVIGAVNSINTGAKETAAGITQTKIGIQKLDEAAQGLKSMV